VPAQGSAALTATFIATAINDFSSDHGYTAAADGINVVVYAPVGYDLDTALDLTVTAAGGGATTGGSSTSAELSATISTPLVLESNANGYVSFADGVLSIVRLIPSNPVSQRFRGLLAINVAGGTPGSGYTYQWSESEVGSGGGMTLGTTTQSNLVVEFTFGPDGGAVTGSFKCVVFDNSTPTPLTITRFVTVKFAYSQFLI
jgi:hypothetical protein